MSEAVALHPARHRRLGLLPAVIPVVVALVPAPAGLSQHAWYFFAIFAGVITGLVIEPLPLPAIGFFGVTAVAVLGRWVLFGPAELARPGGSATSGAINWALSGFASSTVWLVFTAFMFATGYEKTGLGRRIALLLVKAMGRRTLFLGYAITIADTILAPFTPSNTARSGSTIFPIVRNLPALYDSHPNDASSRRIGGYVMWTAFATTGVTSSLFLTALAPNLLAVEIIKKTANIDITWLEWFGAAAPFGITLLLVLPLLAYVMYPPEVKKGEEVPAWAARELAGMGHLSRDEITLGILVLLAVVLWIFGGDYINATTVALLAVSLMVLLGMVSWGDLVGNRAAWNTMILLATLVSLADGLSRVGFIRWFDEVIALHLRGFAPITTLYVLVGIYFFAHYMFASITPHTSAMLPVMLAVGMGIPGMPVRQLALLLAMTHGIMGVITPYATGPAPVFFGGLHRDEGLLAPGCHLRSHLPRRLALHQRAYTPHREITIPILASLCPPQRLPSAHAQAHHVTGSLPDDVLGNAARFPNGSWSTSPTKTS
jgi:L-tartrate/succinate antiporter